MNSDIFKLSQEQKKAFKKLEKAIKECEKAGIMLVNRNGLLYAYNKAFIKGYGDCTSGFSEEESLKVLDACSDADSIHAPGGASWADDDVYHIFQLTKKGIKLYNSED